jgi:hypothetical protein
VFRSHGDDVLETQTRRETRSASPRSVVGFRRRCRITGRSGGRDPRGSNPVRSPLPARSLAQSLRLFLPYSQCLNLWAPSWASGPCDPGNPPACRKVTQGADSQGRMDQTPTIAWEGKETVKGDHSQPCQSASTSKPRAKADLIGFRPWPLRHRVFRSPSPQFLSAASSPFLYPPM